jgi:hypothetical protein
MTSTGDIRMRPSPLRRLSPARTVLAGVAAFLLVGCGTSPRSRGATVSTGATLPAYVSEPVTPKQRLIGQGGRLIVVDGCAACHLTAAGRGIAPSFDEFAGHRITLADGRRVLVDERFLREALLDPGVSPVKGYDPQPMVAALRRLHLSDKPAQVAALAAFIEEIGPENAESEPG